MEALVSFPAVKALHCSVSVNYVLHWFCTCLLPISFDTPQFQYWKTQGTDSPLLVSPAAHELLMHVYNFSPLTHLLCMEKSQTIVEWFGLQGVLKIT